MEVAKRPACSRSAVLGCRAGRSRQWRGCLRTMVEGVGGLAADEGDALVEHGLHAQVSGWMRSILWMSTKRPWPAREYWKRADDDVDVGEEVAVDVARSSIVEDVEQ